MVAVAAAEGGVVTTQRLPAPLAEPGAPIAPLDGSTLVLTPCRAITARTSSSRRRPRCSTSG